MAAQAPHSTAHPIVSSPTLGQVWGAGLIALIAGVALNLLIRSLAIKQLGVSPNFPPLSALAVVFWTTLLTLAATSVRAGFRQLPNGGRIFLWLAAGVLVFSFIPDIALLVFKLYPETSSRAILTLMSMHVVAGTLCMTLLALPTRKA
jgi:hypothetical protein